jgi:hypothetical protein
LRAKVTENKYSVSNDINHSLNQYRTGGNNIEQGTREGNIEQGIMNKEVGKQQIAHYAAD